MSTYFSEAAALTIGWCEETSNDWCSIQKEVHRYCEEIELCLTPSKANKPSKVDDDESNSLGKTDVNPILEAG